MRYLTLDEILALHYYLMTERWNERLYGARDLGVLESAVNRPATAAHYEDSDLFDQAARLWESLSTSHPFHQGNKRTAYAAMEVFLRINGWSCAASDGEIVETCMRLARGEIKLEELTAWLRAHGEPTR